jgi:hypothetical protein
MELEEQHTKMKSHFERREKDSKSAVDPNEDIYEALRAKKEAEFFLRQLTQTSVGSSQELTSGMDYVNNGRINSSETPHTILLRVEQLLKGARQSMDEWIDEEGTPTELYIEYEHKYDESELRRLRAQMWEECTKRVMERDRLTGGLAGAILLSDTDDRDKRSRTN